MRAKSVDAMAVIEGQAMGDRFHITLDPGAGASGWPAHWTLEVAIKPRNLGIKFRGADGGELKYYGRKDIGFRPAGGEEGIVDATWSSTSPTRRSRWRQPWRR